MFPSHCFRLWLSVTLSQYCFGSCRYSEKRVQNELPVCAATVLVTRRVLAWVQPPRDHTLKVVLRYLMMLMWTSGFLESSSASLCGHQPSYASPSSGILLSFPFPIFKNFTKDTFLDNSPLIFSRYLCWVHFDRIVNMYFRYSMADVRCFLSWLASNTWGYGQCPFKRITFFFCVYTVCRYTYAPVYTQGRRLRTLRQDLSVVWLWVCQSICLWCFWRLSRLYIPSHFRSTGITDTLCHTQFNKGSGDLR